MTRAVVSMAMFLLAFTVVVKTEADVGIARDEAVYMHYGDQYATWWRQLAKGELTLLSHAKIRGTFGGDAPTDNNREHPPLMKTLFGFSHQLFYQTLHWTSEETSYRLPSALLFALLIAMVYAYGRRHFGGVAGSVGALLLLCSPRLLFHASLATFDCAVVALWFAVLFCYDRALDSKKFPWTVGVVFGLALATKHNALLLPGVIVAHYLWVAFRDVSGARGRVTRWSAFVRALVELRPSLFVSMAVLGPLVLVALWPWLWFDTLHHLGDWIRFHLGHVHYNYEYLGKNLNAPPFPWHIAVVTVAVTTPVVTLVCAALGAGVILERFRRGERDEDAPAMLLFLSAAVAIGPFLLPTTPIFGAGKHYAAVLPSLCLFAGIGVQGAVRLAARGAGRRREAVIAAALGLLAVAASAAETRAGHPYALSDYNTLAGGPAGGADLGMNRQFWGVAARGVLETLESLAGDDGRVLVYTHDAQPAWPYYQRFGLVSKRLVDSGHEDAGIHRSQLAIVIHELHFNRHDYMIWRDYGTIRPVYVLAVDGVPLVSVYRRPP